MYLISSFVLYFFFMVKDILRNWLKIIISMKLKISLCIYSVINTWLKWGEGQLILLVEKISQWNDSYTLCLSWSSSERRVSHSIQFACVMRGHGFSVYVFVVSILYIMFVQERLNGMFHWNYHEVYI